MKRHRKKKDVPFIQQHSMAECGTTCLAMIFRYHGYYNVQSLLAQLGDIHIDGIDLYTLGEISRQFGFQSDAYELSFEELSQVKLPCIAHYRGNHFIVICDSNADHIWVADPAYGKDKISKEQFLKNWNGIVLTVEPTPEIFKNKDLEESVTDYVNTQKSLFKKFYLPTLNTFRNVLSEVLGLTFLLQLVGLALPFFTQLIIDEVLVNHNKKLLFGILIAMVGIFLLQTFLLYARNVLLLQVRVNFELDFFSRFFDHFLSLKQRYFDRHKREDFMWRFQENLNIRQLASPNIIQTFIDLLFVLLYVPILFFFNLKLAFISGLFIILYILFSLYYTPIIKSLKFKVFYKNIETLGEFLDTLLGMRSVKLLSIENYKFKRWRNKFKKTLNVLLESEQQAIILISIQKAIYFLSHVSVYWIGAYMALEEQLSIGEYLAFISIFTIIMNALNNVALIWINLAELMVTMERINDVFVQQPEQKGYLDTRNNFSINDIIFQNVNFKYSDREETFTLQNLSLRISKGERIGIVGSSGAGKTTLAKLLTNLYPEFDGKIMFDDLDIRKINSRLLRKKVFFFPQDIHIFSGTIRENILYGNVNASMEDVLQATQLADLEEYIKSLHLGYNQMVGDAGSNLSGGEKLKIGFARLFLNDPDLIILDEASSMLDIETEKRILGNVNEFFIGRTIISIAHRIYTLKNCDRILVLAHGSIREQGSHQELMDQKGTYYQLINTYIN